MTRPGKLFGWSLLLCAGVQVLVDRDAHAQTVQLPTFRQFGVSTTVVVPDGGTIGLGGVGHAYDAAYGLDVPLRGPLDRHRRGTRGTSGVRVRAWVHDLEEMDARVLAAPGAISADPTTRARAAAIQQQWDRLRERPSDTAARRSVSDWRRMRTR